ncbi:MAG: TetR/AcrR family transcriptional regulator [Marinibacterium sp.]
MRPNKRSELVEKALTVFYRNGFHATGMDMLVRETGVSKTSMYKHFRTKEDLILAVLRRRDEHFRNWLCRRVEELADTPRGQLLAIFDALREWFEQPEFRGCMFIKASAEYQERDDPIHVQAAEHKRLLQDWAADLARRGGAADPERLAAQIMLLKEGAIVTAVLGHRPDPAGEAQQAARALLDQAG